MGLKKVFFSVIVLVAVTAASLEYVKHLLIGVDFNACYGLLPSGGVLGEWMYNIWKFKSQCRPLSYNQTNEVIYTNPFVIVTYTVSFSFRYKLLKPERIDYLHYCKDIHKVLHKLSLKVRDDDVKFVTVNAQKSSPDEYSSRYHIPELEDADAFPAMLIFKDGHVVDWYQDDSSEFHCDIPGMVNFLNHTFDYKLSPKLFND